MAGRAGAVYLMASYYQIGPGIEIDIDIYTLELSPNELSRFVFNSIEPIDYIHAILEEARFMPAYKDSIRGLLNDYVSSD